VAEELYTVFFYKYVNISGRYSGYMVQVITLRKLQVYTLQLQNLHAFKGFLQLYYNMVCCEHSLRHVIFTKALGLTKDFS